MEDRHVKLLAEEVERILKKRMSLWIVDYVDLKVHHMTNQKFTFNDFEDVLHLGNNLWISTKEGSYLIRLIHELAHYICATEDERNGINWMRFDLDGGSTTKRHDNGFTSSDIERLVCVVQHELLTIIAGRVGIDPDNASSILNALDDYVSLDYSKLRYIPLELNAICLRYVYDDHCNYSLSGMLLPDDVHDIFELDY